MVQICHMSTFVPTPKSDDKIAEVPFSDCSVVELLGCRLDSQPLFRRLVWRLPGRPFQRVRSCHVADSRVKEPELAEQRGGDGDVVGEGCLRQAPRGGSTKRRDALHDSVRFSASVHRVFRLPNRVTLYAFGWWLVLPSLSFQRGWSPTRIVYFSVRLCPHCMPESCQIKPSHSF